LAWQIVSVNLFFQSRRQDCPGVLPVDFPIQFEYTAWNAAIARKSAAQKTE
jgi:hypothetical protein